MAAAPWHRRRRRLDSLRIAIFAVAVLALGPIGPTAVSAFERQPNILFVMADDLGYADVDWRDPQLHTPNLRKLAFNDRTVILDNSYVNQLCTPTRSAFMTGYYPFRTGTQNGVFLHMEPAGVPNVFPFISENLRSLNYSTYLVGKWHLGYCRKEFLPTSRGFDYFYGYYGPQTGYFNHSADQYHRSLRRVVRGLDLFQEVGDGSSVPDYSQQGIYSTELFTESAINLMKSHDHHKPFFMFLSYQSVHPPLQVPTSYEQNCTMHDRNRRIYCGMLNAMDVSIGRVVEFLKSSNLYDNTVIVFTSDNGGTNKFGASNHPLRGEKDTIWEGGTKTTTFIHSPRHIKQHAVRPGLFHVVDWHATLLSLAGAPVETYGDGINQWPYITTGVPRLRRTQFVYNIDSHGSAIRDGDFKLMLGNADRKRFGEEAKVRLFRITTDPTESQEISRSHPALVQRMLNKIRQLKNLMRKNVRRPLNLMGSPERFNGSYSGFWCDVQVD